MDLSNNRRAIVKKALSAYVNQLIAEKFNGKKDKAATQFEIDQALDIVKDINFVEKLEEINIDDFCPAGPQIEKMMEECEEETEHLLNSVDFDDMKIKPIKK